MSLPEGISSKIKVLTIILYFDVVKAVYYLKKFKFHKKDLKVNIKEFSKYSRNNLLE